ncbi:MAG: NADP-dependent oxidoreductase [Pseudomonadota bacterium]
MSEKNRQWRIARRPQGNVVLEDFEYREEDIPTPGPGEFLSKALYLNLAPVMRMYMSGESNARERALDIGEIIHGRAVSEVIESNHPDYKTGDIVQGQTGWQTYCVTKATSQEKYRKVPDLGKPYSFALSSLGMTGFSAYFGFVDCGKPKPGDVVVVSGAAGGVGSFVVQLAKIYDCRVIGIAGGQEKCELIRRLGCDEALDYKSEDIPTRLSEVCPDGIDLYFDNVGGETLTAVLNNLARDARIALCGSISEYMREEPFGLTNYTNLRSANATMKGFFIYNYVEQFDEAEKHIGEWIKQGRLKAVEDIVDGFDQMPFGLARLYTGGNLGVSMCRVRPDPYEQ